MNFEVNKDFDYDECGKSISCMTNDISCKECIEHGSWLICNHLNIRKHNENVTENFLSDQCRSISEREFYRPSNC